MNLSEFLKLLVAYCFLKIFSDLERFCKKGALLDVNIVNPVASVCKGYLIPSPNGSRVSSILMEKKNLRILATF
jgi:hypothetical protein